MKEKVVSSRRQRIEMRRNSKPEHKNFVSTPCILDLLCRTDVHQHEERPNPKTALLVNLALVTHWFFAAWMTNWRILFSEDPNTNASPAAR